MDRPASIVLDGEGASSSRRRNETAAAAAHDDGSESWAAFAESASDEAFCRAWLAVQCGMIGEARAGLLLLQDSAGHSYVPAAVWPDSRSDVTHLGVAAERALSQRRGVLLGLNGSDADTVAPGSVHVAYPIESDSEVKGVVVLDLTARPDAELQAVLRQLLWGAGWPVAMLRGQRLSAGLQVLQRASIALHLVQAVQEHAQLDQSAMAVVNELTTAVEVDRASLGIIRKGRIVLRAISRTAWFDRKSQLIEWVENAMEEALDQQASIAWPLAVEVRGKVSVAQRDLALHANAAAVLTVPLMSRGVAVGALTLERNQGSAFDADTVAVCEAAGELLGPALQSRLERERWLWGRAVEKPAEFWRKLVGPRRPALKLGTLLALVALAFVAFAHGEFRVSARTVVEGSIQRAAVAPFDGYIAEAFVRAGDAVRQGAVLATLDDRELELERVKWQAEAEQAARKYHEALAKHDRATSRILAAQREQAQAQLALVEEKLMRTQLAAPFDAVVVAGDLSQMLGAPVEKGKVLFELAPLDSYRVVLQVDEREIASIAAGQRGELALTGIAGQMLPFTVKSVTPVATAEEGRNFFRVEAQLEDASARLRPGMEGVGKISIGERRLIWIWTRNFVNWLRLALWSWLP